MERLKKDGIAPNNQENLSATQPARIKPLAQDGGDKPNKQGWGGHRWDLTTRKDLVGKVGGPRKELPLEDIKRLYLEGLSSTEIGNKYGLTADTILRRLREMGIPIKPAHRSKR